MTQEKLTCPECGGVMSAGFAAVALDGTMTPLLWVEGTLERKSLTRGAEAEGRLRIQVTTYRCESCGYLKSFAR